MLNVLITVDTEVYPLLPDWRADNLRRDIERDIYGETTAGRYGLSYQLEVLERFGLKAVFFVEGLFASAVGIDPLREMIRQILTQGHEVQLHLHPEWLAWMAEPPVQPAGRWMTNQFDREEQTELIGLGIRNLQAAGAQDIIAFRAGDYAGNLDTLSALAQHNIDYDTSCNPCYACSFPGVGSLRAIHQPKVIDNVREVPVSYWRTWPIGYRHAQITAASFAEMRGALQHAERAGWHSFVIVSHSFELLKNRRRHIDRPLPDPIVVRRFSNLCRFLHDNTDRFRVCGFADLQLGERSPLPAKSGLYSSPITRTAGRILQQLVRRV